MKTKWISFTALMLIFQLVSGQKLVSKNVHVWFYSHTPLEEIEAHNKQSASILDVSSGDFQFSLLIKSFEFKRTLMQEHFNENYMESDKLPKAGFKGKITNLSSINFKKDGIYPTEVAGDLTIHGVTKPITTNGTVEIKGNLVTAKAKFSVVPKDYNIIIPALVEEKIAKAIEITVDAPYNQN